ncbi:ATP-binding protein [Candidatus Margulisiibacteriota bacterium]
MNEDNKPKSKLQHILSVSLVLNSSLKMGRVLVFSMDTIMDLMGTEASSLLLKDIETGELIFEIARGGQGVGNQLQEKKFRLKQGEGIAGQVAESGEPLLVENVEQDERWAWVVDKSFGFKTTSIICVPLKVKDKVIGVVEVINKKGGGYFDSEDLEHLQLLSNQIAIAIDNARIYGELENANLELEEWNKTLKTKVEERTLELKEAYDELKKLDQMKSDFLNVVAHDIRSPLTAISGFSELILESKTNLSDFQIESVSVIYHEVKRLNRLIDDLLSFAKMESGSLQFNLTATDLRKVIDHAFSVFTGDAKSHQVELSQNMPEERYIVDGDETKLSQVVANLLSNALKFTPKEGKVTISADRIEEDNHKLIKVTVEDTGPGIPKEDIDLIFEKFKQSSSEETKRVKGTGLGLYICKEFVAHMGGNLAVESTPGKGSKFYFTLPEKKHPALDSDNQLEIPNP